MIPVALALGLSSVALASEDAVPPPVEQQVVLQKRYRSGDRLAMAGAITAPAGLLVAAAGLLVASETGTGEGLIMTGAGMAGSVLGTALLLAGTDRSNRVLVDLGVSRRQHATAGWVLLGTSVVAGGAATGLLVAFADATEGESGFALAFGGLIYAVAMVPVLASYGGAYALGVHNLYTGRRDAKRVTWSAWADPRQRRLGLALTGRF